MSINYLVVPGAQKCGTSSFCRLLVDYGVALTGPIKEPQFFALEEHLVSQWIGWFQGWLPSPCGNKYILDGSTFYLPSQSAAELLFKHYPQARIIVLVRDPVARAYSGWLHMAKKLKMSEYRSFGLIVRNIKTIKANGTYEAEGECLVRAAKSGEIDLNYTGYDYLTKRTGAPFESVFQDPYVPFRYLGQSLYSRSLERFQSFFGDRVLTVIFEELVSETNKVMNQVADFLNVGSFPDSLVLPHDNPTLFPRSRVSRYFLRWRDGVFAQRVLHAVPEKIVRIIFQQLLSRPERLTIRDAEICRELLDSEYCYWYDRDPRVREFWMYA